MDDRVILEIFVVTVGISATVLGVYGAFIKYLYDGQTTLDQLLRGANGSDGFIEETRQYNREVRDTQREIDRTLQAHSALMYEVVYTLHEISDALDEADEVDDLNMRRLEYLERALKQQAGFDGHAPDYDQSEPDEE